MADARPRIVLLIDADNAPAAKIDVVLNDLASFGETNVRRAYGDWDSPLLTKWKEVLHERSIRPMQQYALTKGKNASDMALVIDAMDLLHRDSPDGFAIVSSDADFTPLAMHLKERGAAVYGYGEEKAPKPFVNACTKFLRLDQIEVVADDAPGTPAQPLRLEAPELRAKTGLVRLLRDVVSSAADDAGWARASDIGQRIRNQSSLDPRNYGYTRWTDLLRATDLFESKNEGASSVAFRDKRNGRNGGPLATAAKPAAKKSVAKKKPATPKA